MYIVSDTTGKINYWYLNDKPAADKKDQRFLEEYLTEGCRVLKKEIDVLSDTCKPFTEKDEARLVAMVNLLVYARKVWEEESICC